MKKHVHTYISESTELERLSWKGKKETNTKATCQRGMHARNTHQLSAKQA
jgi:hypothetical protein